MGENLEYDFFFVFKNITQKTKLKKTKDMYVFSVYNLLKTKL